MNTASTQHSAALRAEWLKRGLPESLFGLIQSIFSEQNGSPAPETETRSTKIEIEAKFPATEQTIAQMRAIGVTVTRSEREENQIFDAAGILNQTNSRLRIRTRSDIDTGAVSALLTVKQPQPELGDGLKREFEFERELTAQQLSRLSTDLAALGYQQVSGYERVRHHTITPLPQVELVIDLLPDIGRFVEIEGDEADVLSAVSALGLSIADAISSPYDSIHAEWCLQQGIPEVDLVVFPPTKLPQTLQIERQFLRPAQ